MFCMPFITHQHKQFLVHSYILMVNMNLDQDHQQTRPLKVLSPILYTERDMYIDIDVSSFFYHSSTIISGSPLKWKLESSAGCFDVFLRSVRLLLSFIKLSKSVCQFCWNMLKVLLQSLINLFKTSLCFIIWHSSISFIKANPLWP